MTASVGFDIPPYPSFMDFKIWEEVAPPKGTVYNYPPRKDAVPSIAGYPAPLKIGTQMYAQATLTKMCAMCTQGGKTLDDTMDWAAQEIEGFMRS